MHLQIMKYHDLINDLLVKVCCVRLRDCKKERKYNKDQYFYTFYLFTCLLAFLVIVSLFILTLSSLYCF